MTDHLEPYRQLARALRFAPPLGEHERLNSLVHQPLPMSSAHQDLTAQVAKRSVVAPDLGPTPDPSERAAQLVRAAVCKHTVVPITNNFQENISDRIDRLGISKPARLPIVMPKIPEPDPNWIPPTPPPVSQYLVTDAPILTPAISVPVTIETESVVTQTETSLDLTQNSIVFVEDKDVVSEVTQTEDITPLTLSEEVTAEITQTEDLTPVILPEEVTQTEDITPVILPEEVTPTEDITPLTLPEEVSDEVTQTEDLTPVILPEEVSDEVTQTEDITPVILPEEVSDEVTQTEDLTPVILPEEVTQTEDITPLTLPEEVTQTEDITPVILPEEVSDEVTQTEDITQDSLAVEAELNDKELATNIHQKDIAFNEIITDNTASIEVNEEVPSPESKVVDREAENPIELSESLANEQQKTTASEAEKLTTEQTKTSNKEKEKIAVTCPECDSRELRKNGRQKTKQKYLCKDCGRQFVWSEPVEEQVKEKSNKTDPIEPTKVTKANPKKSKGFGRNKKK